jgi:cytosine/adenosine deaminase-related metal-dependent hydrolase
MIYGRTIDRKAIVPVIFRLQRIGYLYYRTSLARCLQLSDGDIKILAATKSTVVHNPLSNLRLGSGSQLKPVRIYTRKCQITGYLSIYLL